MTSAASESRLGKEMEKEVRLPAVDVVAVTFDWTAEESLMPRAL